jgi:glycosyltransferase involved in cell wall biosynthesis
VKSDYIISNLAGTGDYLNQKYLVNRVCTWIPNGIDLGPVDVNSVPELQGEQFVISYAGAHGAANNLSVLLEAAALLKDTTIRFHLIGDGPQKESLIAQKEVLGLENVIFFDPVSKSEIYGFLQKSDAFIFILQKSDLFKWGLAPNKLFDYMAMRKPILNCVVSPYDPVKKENLGFSVDVCSPDEIASAARKLLRLSTLERQAMGDRALKYVQENHDYEKISEKLRQLICSIVEGPEGKSKIEST